MGAAYASRRSQPHGATLWIFAARAGNTYAQRDHFYLRISAAAFNPSETGVGVLCRIRSGSGSLSGGAYGATPCLWKDRYRDAAVRASASSWRAAAYIL